MIMIPYEDILHTKGFYKNGSCNCSIPALKFRNKDIVVYVRVSKEQFYIKYRGRRIHPISCLDGLENALGNIQEKV